MGTKAQPQSGGGLQEWVRGPHRSGRCSGAGWAVWKMALEPAPAGPPHSGGSLKLTWRKCRSPSAGRAQMQETGAPRGSHALPPQVLSFPWRQDGYQNLGSQERSTVGEVLQPGSADRDMCLGDTLQPGVGSSSWGWAPPQKPLSPGQRRATRLAEGALFHLSTTRGREGPAARPCYHNQPRAPGWLSAPTSVSGAAGLAMGSARLPRGGPSPTPLGEGALSAQQ